VRIDFNIVGLFADKGSDGCEVRYCITGQGLEDDVEVTTPLDFSARCYAFGVGEQDDFQQNSGVIRSTPRFIILIARIKSRQVYFIIDDVVNCVLKRTGLKLIFEV